MCHEKPFTKILVMINEFITENIIIGPTESYNHVRFVEKQKPPLYQQNH